MKKLWKGPTKQRKVWLELDGEMAAKFEELKDEWGLHNNTEIIRRMVKEMHDFYVLDRLTSFMMPRGTQLLEPSPLTAFTLTPFLPRP